MTKNLNKVPTKRLIETILNSHWNRSDFPGRASLMLMNLTDDNFGKLADFLNEQRRAMSINFIHYYGEDLIESCRELHERDSDTKNHPVEFIEVFKDALRRDVRYSEFNWKNYHTLSHHKDCMSLLPSFDSIEDGIITDIYKVFDGKYIVFKVVKNYGTEDEDVTYRVNLNGMLSGYKFTEFEHALFHALVPGKMSEAIIALYEHDKKQRS